MSTNLTVRNCLHPNKVQPKCMEPRGPDGQHVPDSSRPYLWDPVKAKLVLELETGVNVFSRKSPNKCQFKNYNFQGYKGQSMDWISQICGSLWTMNPRAGTEIDIQLHEGTYFSITKYQSRAPIPNRWACLLKQQSSITIYRLPTKENKLPLSVSSIFRIYIYIYLYVCVYIYIHIEKYKIYRLYIHIYTVISNGKQKTEAQAIFLYPFTDFSLCN
jgi:hypothetical protein